MEGVEKMAEAAIHQCECDHCQIGEDHADRSLHHQVNVFLARLDEQESRWFVALESKRMGHGGDALMSQVTGLHVATIRRGRQELDADLQGRPSNRIRLPGGGRPRVEKKIPRSKRT